MADSMMAPPSLDQDREHLKLLSIFHYIVGAIAGLFACIPIIHLIMGILMIAVPAASGDGHGPPAFLGFFFVLMALAFIVAGLAFALLLILAGRFLATRTHYTFCFVMACVECIFMPLGTVLGVFTILVLSRPSVKQLFSAPGLRPTP